MGFPGSERHRLGVGKTVFTSASVSVRLSVSLCLYRLFLTLSLTFSFFYIFNFFLSFSLLAPSLLVFLRVQCASM